MTWKIIKEAFSLLIPRVVGFTNGKKTLTTPDVRGFFLVLLAWGDPVIINSSIKGKIEQGALRAYYNTFHPWSE